MEVNPVLMGSLSMDSDIPLYSQLVSIVKRNITAGALGAGDQLPSEAELCKTFDVSRSTVRQAIGALEAEGLVVRKQGRGTFVVEPKVRRRSENVYSFTSEIRAMGMTPSSTLIDFDISEPTPDIANILELGGTGVKVYRFTRVRNVNGEPLILEKCFYPQFIYPNLTRELLETHSFYSLLYEVGIIPVNAVDTYEAVQIGGREASLLRCPPESCGFSVQRRTYNGNGMCYAYTQSLIRGDRVRLEVFFHKDGVSIAKSIDKNKNDKDDKDDKDKQER